MLTECHAEFNFSLWFYSKYYISGWSTIDVMLCPSQSVTLGAHDVHLFFAHIDFEHPVICCLISLLYGCYFPPYNYQAICGDTL